MVDFFWEYGIYTLVAIFFLCFTCFEAGRSILQRDWPQLRYVLKLQCIGLVALSVIFGGLWLLGLVEIPCFGRWCE